jgi:hypothetical protein
MSARGFFVSGDDEEVRDLDGRKQHVERDGALADHDVSRRAP